MSAMLKKNKTLKELQLDQNRIRDHGAIHIADALEPNSTLETLWLVKNPITSEAVARFAVTLDRNRGLKRLGLWCEGHVDPKVLQALDQARRRRLALEVAARRAALRSQAQQEAQQFEQHAKKFESQHLTPQSDALLELEQGGCRDQEHYEDSEHSYDAGEETLPRSTKQTRDACDPADGAHMQSLPGTHQASRFGGAYLSKQRDKGGIPSVDNSPAKTRPRPEHLASDDEDDSPDNEGFEAMTSPMPEWMATEIQKMEQSLNDQLMVLDLPSSGQALDVQHVDLPDLEVSRSPQPPVETDSEDESAIFSDSDEGGN